MGSIEDISKPKLVVRDMFRKRCTPEEIGKTLAEMAQRRVANKQKPSDDAPLIDRAMWEYDHAPVRNSDRELQADLLKIIKSAPACTA